MLRFPDSFTWGVATASYQIEGAVGEDGRGPSIWDTFSYTRGKVLNGDTGDVACDHYHRWEDDIALMSNLGIGGYRFSIAWPRIVPAGRGAPNPAGLDFYDRLVDGLLEAGITPFPTLYHWDLPQALDDEGGWLSRDTAEAFADYSGVVVGRLGDRVKTWLTLNEPWVSSHLGYGKGEHAPGHANWSEVWPVTHHLLLAHGLAVQQIREVAPDADVGIVLNLEPQYPASEHPADIEATRLADGYWNRWFLDPLAGRGYPEDAVADSGWNQAEVQPGDLSVIAEPCDLLGVNFYSRKIIVGADLVGEERPGTPPEPEELTEMGWEVYPEGLYDILMKVKREYDFETIYITENGAAYPDELVDGRVEDDNRISYLQRHFAQLHRAIEEGVDVRGYFLWSLMDNFEWAYGYSKRFGLTYVDYPTQQRTVKKSGEWYSTVIAANGLPSA
ncbi:MAG: beta-glucosidase [Acidimicrobiia bacterium]|nr:beta-glucosidase [Acidimicrobiia bacterium]NNF87045.1 beta-glucosidase [Acidimicrobiia bacterium]NNL97119.1 beta-glucosidase [Acidimicrobiia bacterium]RZV47295.1 MAG: beta-glucosidase [Acidimicrobiia bacterium]